jgi:predicted HicB family RNase H-like nuclease
MANDDEVRLTIRLTPELHARLGRAADRDHRSLNAQMISYIERGVTADERKEKRTDGPR